MKQDKDKPEAKASKNEKIKTAVFAFILAAAAFLLYGKALNFGYTELDDYNSVVTCAPAYEQPYSLLKAFKANVMFDKYPSPYYRPAVACIFIIQNKIAGASLKFAHFSTVFLHSLCALTVFFFFRRNLFKTETAFLAALLFTVSCGAMYAAVWITGVQDSSGLLFFILSLAFFIEYIKVSGRGGGGGWAAFPRGTHTLYARLFFYQRIRGFLPFCFSALLFPCKRFQTKNTSPPDFAVDCLYGVLFLYEAACRKYRRRRVIPVPYKSGRFRYDVRLLRDASFSENSFCGSRKTLELYFRLDNDHRLFLLCFF
jgi:hypothetical protein